MVLLSPAQRSTTSQAPHDSDDIIVSLITDDVYCIMDDQETLGFVQRAGTVYVALSGEVFSHAVEVGQSLSWERAIHMVRFK